MVARTSPRVAARFPGVHVDVARVVHDLRPRRFAVGDRVPDRDAHVGHRVDEVGRGCHLARMARVRAHGQQDRPAPDDAARETARQGARGHAARGVGARLTGVAGVALRADWGRRGRRSARRASLRPDAAEDAAHESSARERLPGVRPDPDDLVAPWVDLALREAGLPAGEDRHVVASGSRGARDAVGPRVEFSGRGENEQQALRLHRA